VYERFTDRARQVMILANQEAQRLNHEYIGTEHILLGLVKQGRGAATIVLQNHGLELSKIRLEIEKIAPKGPAWPISDLPQTPQAKKVIEYAIDEARRQKSNTVSTEHVLLGLMRLEDGVAAQVLVNMGVTLADLREQIIIFFPPRETSTNTPKDVPRGKQETVVLSELPAEIMSEVDELDRQITELATEKDEAVSIQDLRRPHCSAIERTGSRSGDKRSSAWACRWSRIRNWHGKLPIAAAVLASWFGNGTRPSRPASWPGPWSCGMNWTACRISGKRSGWHGSKTNEHQRVQYPGTGRPWTNNENRSSSKPVAASSAAGRRE
jgi:hypothetical protein